MTLITSIRDIADRYDAFIIDLWGVMHDGSALYSGAKEAIAFLHETGKNVLFLSNAPRKAARAEATLQTFGIPREQFMQVVTSGQVAYDRLISQNAFGPCYYYLGPGKDEDVLEGLPGIRQTHTPEEADFILNAGFEYDYQPEAEIEPLLQRLLAMKLPLLCVNPDIEVVKQDGTRLLCAGWVAARYGELGGTVTYLGKPYAEVYEVCFALFDKREHQSASGRVSAERAPKILAIGDNLHTDIKGANAMGIDSLLITGGILTSDHGETPGPEKLADLCRQAGAQPTYVAELFRA